MAPYTEYFMLLLCCICMSDILAAENVRFSHFKMVPSLKDYVITDSATWVQGNVRSPSYCFAACLEETCCKSVFYNKLTKDCTGHSIVHTSTAMAFHDQGNRYYVNLNPTGLEECTKHAESVTESLPSLTTNEVTISLPSCIKKTDTSPGECPTYDGYTMDVGAELCYKIFTNTKDMTSAKEFCMDSHTSGRLAVLNTPDKMEAVTAACKAHPQQLQLWLGAERCEDGTLDHWSDGSPIDTSIWNDGEPNNWGGYEGCITMDGRRGYLVNDENCNFVLNYICEVPMA